MDVGMSVSRMPLWFVTVLTIAAVGVLLPYAPWIALALWLGIYARRFHIPLTKRLHGRSTLAATLTVSLLLVVAVPIGALLTSVAIDAIALVQRILEAEETRQVLSGLVSPGASPNEHPIETTQGMIDLVLQQGDRAWMLLQTIAGAAAHVVIGLLVMVTGIYGVLVFGPSWYAWCERHVPLDERHFRRLGDVFVETGRGLWWGIIGAGIIQSVLATIAYLVLGVPSALALGLLTLMFSMVPAIGTALVWGPVAAGLAVTGQVAEAVALAAVGLVVISTIDNLVRPWLARRGHLALPTWVVLLSMFGGIELFGGWGLLMGPLIVRLAKEVLVIYREEQVAKS